MAECRQLSIEFFNQLGDKYLKEIPTARVEAASKS
jgi:hypothetical protein